MIALACSIAGVAISVALLLNLYRLIVGPDNTDRILALDTMVVNGISLVVIFSLYAATTMYFEAALIFALIGFVTTISFCKFLLRGNVME